MNHKNRVISIFIAIVYIVCIFIITSCKYSGNESSDQIESNRSENNQTGNSETLNKDISNVGSVDQEPEYREYADEIKEYNLTELGVEDIDLYNTYYIGDNKIASVSQGELDKQHYYNIINCETGEILNKIKILNGIGLCDSLIVYNDGFALIRYENTDNDVFILKLDTYDAKGNFIETVIPDALFTTNMLSQDEMNFSNSREYSLSDEFNVIKYDAKIALKNKKTGKQEFILEDNDTYIYNLVGAVDENRLLILRSDFIAKYDMRIVNGLYGIYNINDKSLTYNDSQKVGSIFGVFENKLLTIDEYSGRYSKCIYCTPITSEGFGYTSKLFEAPENSEITDIVVSSNNRTIVIGYFTQMDTYSKTYTIKLIDLNSFETVYTKTFNIPVAIPEPSFPVHYQDRLFYLNDGTIAVIINGRIVADGEGQVPDKLLDTMLYVLNTK